MSLTQQEQAWCPLYKWRQTKQSITITAFIPCLEDDDVTFHIDTQLNTLVLHAKRTAKLAGNHNFARSYTLSLSLAHAVDSAKSAYTLRHDHVRIDLVKAHATRAIDEQVDVELTPSSSNDEQSGRRRRYEERAAAKPARERSGAGR